MQILDILYLHNKNYRDIEYRLNCLNCNNWVKHKIYQLKKEKLLKVKYYFILNLDTLKVFKMVCASISLKSNINNHGCVQTFFAVCKRGVVGSTNNEHFICHQIRKKTSVFFPLVINYRILSCVRTLLR